MRLPLFCLVVVLLAGCAATPSSREVRTDSDQTDADRRAAVRMELAQGYFANGQFNTALDELKQALLSKPDLREAVSLRGLIYAAMGENQLAEENFKRALSQFQNDADVLHNYGWFLCQQQRWREAHAQFDLAVQQASYRAPQRTLLAKGVCEAREGRMKAAEITLGRAFELDAGSPAIAINLAEVLYRNRELERARFYVKRVNAVPEQVSPASLWLALRIERKLGNTVAADDLASQLRKRYAASAETRALDAGQFDE